MSQENVEVLRRAYRGYQDAAAGKESLSSVVAAFADSSIEWHPVQEPSAKLGRHGVAEAMQGWFDTWADVRIDPEEFAEQGDTVLVCVRVSGRGRMSGLETSGLFFHVWTMRDHKAIRFREFSERADALEAAGLSE
jgi:ketosteroid isomerase-like protein